jgi:hypothetical protein
MQAGLGLTVVSKLSRRVVVWQVAARSDRSHHDLVHPYDPIRDAVAAHDSSDATTYGRLMKAFVGLEATGEALTVLGAGGVAAFSSGRELRRRAAPALGAAAYAVTRARETRTLYLVYWRHVGIAGGGFVESYAEIVTAAGGTIAVGHQIIAAVRSLLGRRRGRRSRDGRLDRGYL